MFKKSHTEERLWGGQRKEKKDGGWDGIFLYLNVLLGLQDKDQARI